MFNEMDNLGFRGMCNHPQASLSLFRFVCIEAREKGAPYARAGPCAFFHDPNLLIDTPAEIVSLLNCSPIQRINYLVFTHLDPDHTEGFRVVEQVALDFRNWRAYPEKQIRLLLPEPLVEPLREIRSPYGSFVDFYEESGFIHLMPFEERTCIEDVEITAIPVDRGTQQVFVYVFKKLGRKVIYAPCDIKPFPEDRKETESPDLLIIQPGIFEKGLRNDFRYPVDHISRETLYTFEQTLALAERLDAKNILFVHLEEYWNRSYDDYCALESMYPRVRFAYDGMEVEVT